MLETLAHDIVGPIARRVGTLVGGALAGLGLSGDHVNAVAAGAAALVGIGVDLALIYYRNKRRF